MTTPMTPDRLDELTRIRDSGRLPPGGMGEEEILLVYDEFIREIGRQALIIKNLDDVAESNFEALRQEWVETLLRKEDAGDI